jgi:hypothetical protein
LTVYFWRIEEVVRILATRELTERESLRYFLANWIVLTILSAVHVSTWNDWDTVEAVLSAVITIAAILFCYRANGGADGRSFLPRFMAIMWVMTVRALVAVLLLLIVVFIVADALGQVADETVWWEVLMTLGIQLVLYWRMAVHLKSVRESSTV